MATANKARKAASSTASTEDTKSDKIARIVGNPELNKSTKIRQLAALQLTTSEIALAVGVRYQHAYNVLHKELKRPANTAK